MSGYLYLTAPGLAQAALLAQLLLPVFLTVALYNGAYSHATLQSSQAGMLRAMSALAISAGAVVFIAYYTKSSAAFSRVTFTDDTVAELGAHGARTVGGHGFLRVSIDPLGMRARITKRLFDIAAAGTALVLLSPILLVVAVAILIEDGSPVLLVQRRVGRANRFFQMYKFRSMATGRADQDGHRSTAREDERVTRVGRFIRRTSIDELPQLFNVIKGEMAGLSCPT